MKYSEEERQDIIFVLGECLEITSLELRIYSQKFSERRHPDRRVFEGLKDRNNGYIKYKKS